VPFEGPAFPKPSRAKVSVSLAATGASRLACIHLPDAVGTVATLARVTNGANVSRLVQVGKVRSPRAVIAVVYRSEGDGFPACPRGSAFALVRLCACFAGPARRERRPLQGCWATPR
jgi:hypothetical protein